MAGKHAASGRRSAVSAQRRGSRRRTVALAVAGVSSVALAGAGLAYGLDGAVSFRDSAQQSMALTTEPTNLAALSAQHPQTGAARASRDNTRTPVASTTPRVTPTAKPRATTPIPKPSPTKSSSYTVVSSGTCQASYYGTGQMTASGEVFDPSKLTAASKTLPFDTKVRVTNVANGTSVIVRINDRGPYVSGRCLDLSTAAFSAIGSTSAGVLTVKYQVLKSA